MGIFETTGLDSEIAAGGWLAITTDSKRMAAWMCAAVILENVDARCEDDRLFVPADPSFQLKDQVKSVITVVSKTHHYWAAHMSAVEEVGPQLRARSTEDQADVAAAGQRYRKLLSEWGQARMAHDVGTASRLHQQAHDMTRQLGATSDGRAQVEAGLEDVDEWVRVGAAGDVIRWSPEIARPILDSIRSSGDGPAMDAAFALMQYESGRLRREP